MESEQSAAQKVFSNEYLLEKITKHMNIPERIKAQTTSRSFYRVINNYPTSSNTLKIVQLDSHIKHLVSVKFDGKVRTYRLEDENFTDNLQEGILSWINEERIPFIRKVVFRGKIADNARARTTAQLKVSLNFGNFLDRFTNLKHLECTHIDLVNFLDEMIDPEAYQFHRRIKILNVVGSKCLFLRNIVRPNLLELHLTESLNRDEIGIGLFEMGALNLAPPTKIIVYIDDPDILFESRRSSNSSRTGFLTWYHDQYIELLNSLYLIPYHFMFKRTVDFNFSTEPNLKFAKNLTTLKLINFTKNTKRVSTTIKDVCKNSKLEKLELDGLLTAKNVMTLIKYLKKCKTLKYITIQCLPHSDENRKLVANLVGNLPRHIVSVLLLNPVRDDAIKALGLRFHRNKLVRRNKYVVRSRFVARTKFVSQKRVVSGHFRSKGKHLYFFE